MANTRIRGCCRERALGGVGLGRPSRLNQEKNDQDRGRKITTEDRGGRYYRQSERSSEISRPVESASTCAFFLSVEVALLPNSWRFLLDSFSPLPLARSPFCARAHQGVKIGLSTIPDCPDSRGRASGRGKENRRHPLGEASIAPSTMCVPERFNGENKNPLRISFLVV